MLAESFSGIRGIYGKELTLDIAKRYAYVFQEFLKKKTKKKSVKIVVGYDTRPSSPDIKKAIIDVLEGEVIDVEYASTPATELAVRIYGADAGIMITASHNEPEYNGFKFLDHNGSILSRKDAEKVIALYNKIKKRKIKFKKNNKMVVNNYRQLMLSYADYVYHILGDKGVSLIHDANFKVIIDPNGGTGDIASRVLMRFGIEVISLNMEHGKFTRLIEPNESSLSHLKDHIKKNNADLAAGFDCDADRVEILDNNGNMLNGHKILALLVDSVLSNAKKGAKKKTIVTNDATSCLVKDITQKYKYKLKEVEVGEANVIEAMYKLKSPVGGEGSSSGGILPPSRCRDGVLTLVMILRLMAQRKQKLSEILAKYPPYFESRTKIKFNPRKHDSIKRKLIKFYRKKKYKIQKLGGIEAGLKIIVDKKSFIYFRASKTEACQFRIIVDTNEKKKSDELLKEAEKLFKKIS